MLGRFALAGLMLAALGAPAALAGSGHPSIWLLKKQCHEQSGAVKLCLHQFANGDRNWSVTKQKTVLNGRGSSTTFAVTIQEGDDNIAYTEQIGTDQSAKTIQVGDRNFSGTFQHGNDQSSKTVQTGNGHWSVTGSVGDGTSTSVESYNY